MKLVQTWVPNSYSRNKRSRVRRAKAESDLDGDAELQLNEVIRPSKKKKWFERVYCQLSVWWAGRRLTLSLLLFKPLDWLALGLGWLYRCHCFIRFRCNRQRVVEAAFAERPFPVCKSRGRATLQSQRLVKAKRSVKTLPSRAAASSGWISFIR